MVDDDDNVDAGDVALSGYDVPLYPGIKHGYGVQIARSTGNVVVVVHPQR